LIFFSKKEKEKYHSYQADWSFINNFGGLVWSKAGKAATLASHIFLQTGLNNSAQVSVILHVWMNRKTHTEKHKHCSSLYYPISRKFPWESG